jgi:hypothetical protein
MLSRMQKSTEIRLPPIDVSGLLPMSTRDAVRWWLAPVGPMTPYLRRRYSTARAVGEFQTRQECRWLRAYPVPALLGLGFTVHDAEDARAKVVALLAEHLPGVGFSELDAECFRGAFEKYHLLHQSIGAPPNERTGTPMALEFCAQRKRQVADGTHAMLVTAATYSNVRYPGIGVPFYM